MGRIRCFSCLMQRIFMEPFSRIHFGGGGSRSDKLLKLRADLIQAPVGRMENIELPSIGACMLSGIGNGIYRDVEDAAGAMVKGAEYFRPREESLKAYEGKYRKYKRLSSVYLNMV